MKNIAVLGCTGSIGRSTISVLKKYRDEFRVTLFANFEKEEELVQLKNEFPEARTYCYKTAMDKEYLYRPETYLSSDIIVNGIAGIAGLKPSAAVLIAGKILATANKESLVCAGGLLKKIMERSGGVIYPLDSEHSSVWQLLHGQDLNNINRIILTCSGGAFRDLPKDKIAASKSEKALMHPNWKMGKKVTIDCATLINKGMEIIEAKHLFNVDSIDAVGHKESVVHAFLEMKDNSVLASLSNPDMVLPIQYALFYPIRKPSSVPEMDFRKVFSLHFFELDNNRFPGLKLCEEASGFGDVGGTILNAADEELVKKYLSDKCRFYDITDYIKKALDKFAFSGFFSDLKELFCMDEEVREYILSEICS